MTGPVPFRSDTGSSEAALDIAELLRHARDASDFLKALAHESRLVILCLLVDGEKSVMELAELLGERQPAVSQQLARLKGEHLVRARRDGKHIYYSLARDEVRAMIVALHAAFCAPSCGVRRTHPQVKRSSK